MKTMDKEFFWGKFHFKVKNCIKNGIAKPECPKVAVMQTRALPVYSISLDFLDVFSRAFSVRR